MKVLFAPVYITTPHFETELELMLKHVNLDDEVFVLQCNENLFSCEKNPNHFKSICFRCKSRFKKGTSMIENINILRYPESEINYDRLNDKFKDIEELINYSIDGINLGIGVASSLIDRYHDHKLDTTRYSKEIQIELKSAYLSFKTFEETIKKIKPDLIYIFNGRFSTLLPMILCAEKYNINYYTHERTGGQLNKYTLYENSIPHLFDYAGMEIKKLWKLNFNNRETTGEVYFNERRNRIEQSWYSFTANQKNNLLPSNIPEDKSIISIFNSTIGEYAAVRGCENPFTFFKDEYDCLTSIFDYYRDDNTLQFYLRIHPNLAGFQNTQIKQLKSFIGKYKNVEIILPESQVDTYKLVDVSDKIIVFGSTIGVEACFWGKPVIALATALYKDIDCCYWPKTFQELHRMIKGDLIPKDRIEALKYGNWEKERGNNFEFVKLESLFKGKFLNKEIKMNTFQTVIYYCLRMLEIKDIKELIRLIRKTIMK